MTILYLTYLWMIISTGLTGMGLLMLQYLRNKEMEKTLALSTAEVSVSQPIPVEQRHNH
jgi:hypothetical protein